MQNKWTARSAWVYAIWLWAGAQLNWLCARTHASIHQRAYVSAPRCSVPRAEGGDCENVWKSTRVCVIPPDPHSSLFIGALQSFMALLAHRQADAARFGRLVAYSLAYELPVCRTERLRNETTVCPLIVRPLTARLTVSSVRSCDEF